VGAWTAALSDMQVATVLELGALSHDADATLRASSDAGAASGSWGTLSSSVGGVTSAGASSAPWASSSSSSGGGGGGIEARVHFASPLDSIDAARCFRADEVTGELVRQLALHTTSLHTLLLPGCALPECGGRGARRGADCGGIAGTRVGTRALADVAAHAALTSLDLSHTHADDETLRLAVTGSVRTLLLAGCKGVTSAGVSCAGRWRGTR
jgi:hypothetical protein